MSFGIAELQDKGWLLRSEFTFDDFREAIAVANVLSIRNAATLGVAFIDTRVLVWRSDAGDLSLPCLGVRPPSSFPPAPG
jgi:hypothetical protein